MQNLPQKVGQASNCEVQYGGGGLGSRRMGEWYGDGERVRGQADSYKVDAKPA